MPNSLFQELHETGLIINENDQPSKSIHTKGYT
jgi:hypothetical protein